MAQVINTNSLSLMAQNNLNKSQSSLGTAIERLSSGLRINSAKDDAAGQAISNRFTANIKGLTQASRNANDGISLAQTTEGALNEVNDNLQNIRRLSVQAQNGSNSTSDLKSIQDEIDQRLSEINRISEQTDFNGVKVLSSNQKLTIQVGANDGETIDIELKDVNAKTLGLDSFSISDKKNQVGGIADKAQASIALASVEADTAATNKLTSAGLVSYSDKDGNTQYAVKVAGTGGKDDSYYAATVAKDGKVSWDSSAAGANVTTSVSNSKDVAVGDKVLHDVAKADLTLADGESLHKFTDASGNQSNIIKDKDGKYFDTKFDPATGKMTKGAENTAAYSPLDKLDKALAQVDGVRSSLGAVQNRFDSVINNLNSTVNNLSASQSRIQDADYATEVSNMSRANILQQAGTSVLAQANQSTQNVLSLLR
ncbi:FliC/FljB family flagellin [Serratia marcescens]|uniref:FliC/FljB family flagellin n=1 Tax=Serratia TaxID=613 RepID=UPI00066DD288|nr:FliC/FljB family flagellin [Serratia marcescens]MBI6131962.1 FliC/FljB family flagellin [Serratia marcescens]NSM18181.1 FliC/FljB family flagellin [Serratia marcescens]NSM49795.1 FliC/FljB family flagellin [Serratia marcescens]CAI1548619.1 Flagellin [Serratia marcescens]BEN40459.1 flagellin [Serratia marcescens]